MARHVDAVSQSKLGLLLLPLAAGCLYFATAREATVSDYDSIAEAAIRSIENGGASLTYVLPDESEPRVRAAIGARRAVIKPADLPWRDGVKLPAGYALLEGFVVKSDDATVSVLVGTDHWGPLSCGSSIEVRLKPRREVWAAFDRGESVC